MTQHYVLSEIAYFSIFPAVKQIIRFLEHRPRYSYYRQSFLLRKYIKRHINHKSLLFKGVRPGSEKTAVCFSSFFPGPFVNFIRKIATLKFPPFWAHVRTPGLIQINRRTLYYPCKRLVLPVLRNSDSPVSRRNENGNRRRFWKEKICCCGAKVHEFIFILDKTYTTFISGGFLKTPADLVVFVLFFIFQL